jgi:hypothetical protein
MKGGILDHWKSEEKRKIIKNNKVVYDSEQELSQNYNNLNLEQLQSSLYLFPIGIIGSSLMLIFEVLRKHKFF